MPGFDPVRELYKRPPDILVPSGVLACLGVSKDESLHLLPDYVFADSEGTPKIGIFGGERFDEVTTAIDRALAEAAHYTGDNVIEGRGAWAYRLYTLTHFSHVLEGMKLGMEKVQELKAQHQNT